MPRRSSCRAANWPSCSRLARCCWSTSSSPTRSAPTCARCWPRCARKWTCRSTRSLPIERRATRPRSATSAAWRRPAADSNKGFLQALHFGGMAMAETATKQPVLEMQHISKRFDATQALEDVSLTLYPGEVHALIGENGAGKSTLIKVMTGVHRPDTGTILLDGKPTHINNSQEAQTLGIAAIYQEPMIFPDLNVAENIFISHRNRGMVVGWGRMYKDAEAILAQLDVKLDVRMPARGLTLAAQQAVEIGKAISLKVRVLIMDEPTASLSAHEVDQLFRLVNTLRNQGVAILFIGHRMEEVFRIADRITVLRDGKFISSRPKAEVKRDQVIREMVGRDAGDFFAKSEVPRGDLLMSVRGLGKEGAFTDVNFDVYQGEVLGFAGLIGARRTDVGLALFGIEPADTGEIV